MLLRDYLDGWLKDSGGSVKANTYTSYESIINNHIAPSPIGGIEVEELKPRDIQLFLNGLRNRRTGGQLAPKTVWMIYSMLKTALDYGPDYGIMQRNPCVRLRLPKLEGRDAGALTVREQRLLETAISESKDSRHIGILLCLYTGLRLGELCALKWKHVDFALAEIHVKKSTGRVTNRDGGKGKTKIVEDTPKSGKSVRSVPVPAFLLKHLRRAKSESRSEYVVSGKDGGRVQPRTMQNLFYGLSEKSGIGKRNFHILRHTFATRAAIDLGIDINTLSEILGHSSPVITLKRYAHPLREQKRAVARMMDRYRQNGLRKDAKFSDAYGAEEGDGGFEKLLS